MIQDRRFALEMTVETHTVPSPDTRFAIVLNGVSDQWQRNVLQIRGDLIQVQLHLEGYGTIEAPAIALSPEQARHVAEQITEILAEARSGPAGR
jgi:hypothetical protein